MELFLLLVLLERVFLRVAAAETDEKLEQVLGRFLAPVLLKLASPIEDVKKKAGRIDSRLNYHSIVHFLSRFS